MIIPALCAIFGQWSAHFRTPATWHRACRHALVWSVLLGRSTISALLRVLGTVARGWHADYRFYSQSRWEPDALFNTLLSLVLPRCAPDYLVVGVDDTGVAKTGKRIPFVSWGRDPLSPPFHVNLRRQLRFLHVVALLPEYTRDGRAARAIPLRFVNAPPAPKPKATASEAERAQARLAQDAARLPAVARRVLADLRQVVTAAGHAARTVLAVLDGSFCNTQLFREPLPGVELLARCRKDLTLCHPAAPGGRRVYAPETFTPEAVRQDAAIPWQTGTFWYGGALREIGYKEVPSVLWRSGARRRPLRLFVLAATPYRRRKRGRLNYRAPGYLLTTDRQAPAAFLIQSYLDRWQIEVAHREEKTLLRVGQAQVWHPTAVVRQPAFTVAVYGAVLLAALQTTGTQRTDAYLATPGWYTGAERPSFEDIQRALRRELLEQPDLLAPFGLRVEAKALVLAAAA